MELYHRVSVTMMIPREPNVFTYWISMSLKCTLEHLPTEQTIVAPILPYFPDAVPYCFVKLQVESEICKTR